MGNNVQQTLSLEVLDIDFAAIGSKAILVIVLFLISAALNYAQAFILGIVSAKYTRDMREKIIDKIDQNYTESDLTLDQAQRLAAASFQLLINGGTELMEDAIDEAADAIEDATDEAVDAVEDALEEIGL